MNDIIRLRIYSSMLDGWSPTGTFVRPGRSIKVRSTTFEEKIVREIGCVDTPLFLPAIFAVWISISSRTLSKSRNFWFFRCKNSAYSCLSFAFGSIHLKLSTKGHLVTIPVPLGKKSLPTIDSITELLPEDYAPTLTIEGSSMQLRARMISKVCWSLMNKGIRSSIINY